MYKYHSSCPLGGKLWGACSTLNPRVPKRRGLSGHSQQRLDAPFKACLPFPVSHPHSPIRCPGLTSHINCWQMNPHLRRMPIPNTDSVAGFWERCLSWCREWAGREKLWARRSAWWEMQSYRSKSKLFISKEDQHVQQSKTPQRYLFKNTLTFRSSSHHGTSHTLLNFPAPTLCCNIIVAVITKKALSKYPDWWISKRLRLLVGWWHHSVREGPGEKEQVWRKGWGISSWTYQVTGHSGSCLELRVLGRLRQGNNQIISQSLWHMLLSIRRNPAPVPERNRGAPTGTDDNILVVELGGEWAEGQGSQDTQELGTVDIHQQVTTVYLVYTGWVRALGLKAEKPDWKMPPCKSRQRAPSSSWETSAAGHKDSQHLLESYSGS